jgi:RNA polymerase sigma factor (sigma-70 family)
MEAAPAIRMTLPAQLRVRRFERECERLRPLGEAYVQRRFGGSLNRADAEDAVAEVLIRLHHQMEVGRPPQNLRAAFFTSVRNAAIDQLRSRAAKPTVALEAAGEVVAFNSSPAERAESREDAVRLQEALARMRGNYREAIVLRFGLGLTVPEIARHLQISLPAAKKLVLRATQQVKKRLEAIDGAEFCPEMREAARRSLFEKQASGLASEAEAQILRTHFEHCGSCKSFLASLHETLYELGSGALLAGVAARSFGGGKIGVVDHLMGWLGDATHGVQVVTGKLRFAAFKATGAFQSGDATSAGALAGTGQKIAAICTAGAATTATCLATGVIGPGIGISTPPPASGHDSPPPQVKTVTGQVSPLVVEALPSIPAPESNPTPVSGPSSGQAAEHNSPPPSTSPPSETPSSESSSPPSTEFGVESSPPPPPVSTPEPTTASSPSPSNGVSSTATSGGSTESFGFQK